MLKPKDVPDIPAQFAEFCQRIGATFTGCNSNGGLLVLIWTGTFTGEPTCNFFGAFYDWCAAVGAGIVGLVLESDVWTATFTTQGAGGIIPPAK